MPVASCKEKCGLARIAAVAFAVASFLALRAAEAQQARAFPTDPTSPMRDEPRRDEKGTGLESARFGAEARAQAEYSTNLFHVQERRLSDFETRRDPGERFHQMQGPGDLVTRVGARGGMRLDVAKKRDFDARLGADYNFHARNPIANYFGGSLRLRYDATKRDRIESGLELIPRRFKKNYREDGSGGAGPFVPAYYAEVEPYVGYRHEWTKAWSTELIYELRLRRFEAPAENRGEARHQGFLRSRHRITKRVRAALEGGGGFARTPDQLEGGGFLVDRSYAVLTTRAKLGLRPIKRLETGLTGEYRFKRFTTDEPADTARHGRRDHRVGAGVYIEHRIHDHFELEGSVGWKRNLTNRTDPRYDADEFAYEEIVFGVGIVASM